MAKSPTKAGKLSTTLRNCTCNDITKEKLGEEITICGWVMSKRNHGGIIFADIRDHYGIVQATVDTLGKKERETLLEEVDKTPNESVVQITGKVKEREPGTERPEIPTGEVEIEIEKFAVLSSATNELPFQIDDNAPEANESIRLANRFLDLRRTKMQNHLKTRAKVLQFLRNEMAENGFLEVQTPILTAPTPEGATDYLVPSRLHPAHYYALPQSPQQFKQLLMVGGIDRYFQIAPCFRNEDARADRAVGEFYQLDAEMSFVEQEDVINTIEPIVKALFNKFKPEGYTTNYESTEENKKPISAEHRGAIENYSTDKPDLPIPTITYKQAIEDYGTDKPDLRIPTKNHNLTEVFRNSGFGIFKNAIAKGSIVISILAPKTASNSRSFFDTKIDFAKSLGGGGLAYIKFKEDGTLDSPIVKLLTEAELNQIKTTTNAQNGDTVFFACEQPHLAYKIAGEARLLLGKELELIQPNTYQFLWVKDFPMFEIDPHTGKVSFSHNPFSKATENLDYLRRMSKKFAEEGAQIATENLYTRGSAEETRPLDEQTRTVLEAHSKACNNAIKEMLEETCQQYDLVCNGYEIGSGGIRNTNPEEMASAFEMCGVNITHFNAMYKAFLQAGTPPHGGIALGLERLLMLLCQTTNIRDVIAFPLNSNGIDNMMEAPRMVTKAEQEKSFSTDYTKLGIQEQLHYACMHNLPELAKTAISKGANINYQGNYGKTPLMIAAQSSSIEVIKYMVGNEEITKNPILGGDTFGRTAGSYVDRSKKQARETLNLLDHSMSNHFKKLETENNNK